SDQLATRLGAHPPGIERLCDFLVLHSQLQRTGDSFHNTPAMQRWFTPGGDVDFTSGLRWTAQAWTLMPELTRSLRAGKPAVTLWQHMHENPTWGPLFS